MTREAFGPNLRRLRLQHGVSLDQIAAATKVPADVWDGLEHNDLRGWPVGIFARAYVREYARLIGADPEATVDEFCRWFPNGDRRLAGIVRAQAEIVGHELDYEETPPSGEERRASAAAPVRSSEGVRSAARTLLQPWTGFVAACAQMFLRVRRRVGRA
jgi:transcriptional regulator with XRE-family HTH domain